MMQDNEIWRPVVGYEGIYEVSNFGRIRRVSAARGTNPGYIFTPSPDHKGYLRTRLTNSSGISKTVKVHRIVCIAFHDNPRNLPQVNHKDTIKTNNKSINLEWCDNKYNNAHAIENGIIPKGWLGKKGVEHNKSIPFLGTNIDTGETRIFNGTYEAAREVGSNIGSIWRVRKGLYKHTKRWSFEKY